MPAVALDFVDASWALGSPGTPKGDAVILPISFFTRAVAAQQAVRPTYGITITSSARRNAEHTICPQGSARAVCSDGSSIET